MGNAATLAPRSSEGSASRSRRGRLGFVAVLMTGAFLLAACGMTPDQQHAFDKVNGSRSSRSIATLAQDNTAQEKAQAWAEHLASSNRLAHSDLAAGMDRGWKRLGENVGYGSSVGGVHQQFMESASHRANILNNKFTHVGVGVAQGHGRTFVVHVYVQR